VETLRAKRECRVQKEITELHRTLDAAVDFGLWTSNSSKKLCVKNKWVKQEHRTLDPEWRDSAGSAQKGNNGSRRPYIKPQGASSWIISRS